MKGNLDCNEAASLARDAGIRLAVPHHLRCSNSTRVTRASSLPPPARVGLPAKILPARRAADPGDRALVVPFLAGSLDR